MLTAEHNQVTSSLHDVIYHMLYNQVETRMKNNNEMLARKKEQKEIGNAMEEK